MLNKTFLLLLQNGSFLYDGRLRLNIEPNVFEILKKLHLLNDGDLEAIKTAIGTEEYRET